MAEQIQNEPELSRRELTNAKEKAFTEILGPHYGDIYRQVHNLYPCREIEQVSAFIDPKRSYFSGGAAIDSEGKTIPAIVIGTNEAITSRTLKDRIASRFGIPLDLLDSNVGGMVCRMVALAHELGHVVQMNPDMQERFGGLKASHKLPDGEYDDEEYFKYLSSEKEGNADYIAASVLAHTKLFGEKLGLKSPIEDPSNWRTWVENHPVILSTVKK